MRCLPMSSSTLAFDEAHAVAPAPVRARSYSKAGLSPVAKVNCLALVCLMKVGLGVLLLTQWDSGSDKRLETVLTVRTLAEDTAPLPLKLHQSPCCRPSPN